MYQQPHTSYLSIFFVGILLMYSQRQKSYTKINLGLIIMVCNKFITFYVLKVGLKMQLCSYLQPFSSFSQITNTPI